jgi:hypothetical protein
MFFHLRLGLPSCLYSSSFPIKSPYIWIFSPIASHCLTHLLKYFLHNLCAPSGEPVPFCCLCSPRREKKFFLNVGRVLLMDTPLCSTIFEFSTLYFHWSLYVDGLFCQQKCRLLVRRYSASHPGQINTFCQSVYFIYLMPSLNTLYVIRCICHMVQKPGIRNCKIQLSGLHSMN